jgi:Uncharacterized flavoproteins
MINLSKDIYYVGVNDRRTELFENHIPIPNGISYNSYLIVDEKITLIDPVESEFTGEYLAKIKSIIGDKAIDYLVVNHDEPDHSGSIHAIIAEYPKIQIIGNSKTFGPLEAFYGPIENKIIVAEGQTLSIGQHELQFFMIPMVHWPESMVTYETTEKIAFSNDAFGGFGTLGGTYFDDEANLSFFEDDLRRYYANIVGKMSNQVQKAMQKLSGLEIRIIAPSHGLIWRSNLAWILDKYNKWSTSQGELGVVVIYGSMYGNTARMADIIARGVAQTGIKEIRVYDVSRTSISDLISDIWKYKGVIIGSCTHYGNIFPPMELLLHELEQFQPKNKKFGVFGSMSWAGAGAKCICKSNDILKWTQIGEIVEVKGAPIGQEDIDRLWNLGKQIGESIQS